MVGLATGCVGIGDFDPVGDSASIAGAWLVDGESPTAAKCAQLGAIRIQVSFLDMQRSVTHSGLRFECPTASFDTDGPGGSGKVVAAPEASESPWRLRLEAVDDSGTVIAFGDTYTVLSLIHI